MILSFVSVTYRHFRSTNTSNMPSLMTIIAALLGVVVTGILHQTTPSLHLESTDYLQNYRGDLLTLGLRPSCMLEPEERLLLDCEEFMEVFWFGMLYRHVRRKKYRS